MGPISRASSRPSTLRTCFPAVARSPTRPAARCRAGAVAGLEDGARQRHLRRAEHPRVCGGAGTPGPRVLRCRAASRRAGPSSLPHTPRSPRAPRHPCPCPIQGGNGLAGRGCEGARAHRLAPARQCEGAQAPALGAEGRAVPGPAPLPALQVQLGRGPGSPPLLCQTPGPRCPSSSPARGPCAARPRAATIRAAY